MSRQTEKELMEIYREGFKDGYSVGFESGKKDATESAEFYDQGICIGVKMLNDLLKRFVRADAYLEALPYIEHVIEAHGGDLENEEEEEEAIKWDLHL